MATTTNFGWATPDDTDLVKDGAAAIRTLGSSIDTSFVDLKGGTTGQTLTKTSNTDLDFTWATPGGGFTFSQVASTSLSGNSTITFNSLTYNYLFLAIEAATLTSDGGNVYVELNGNTGNNYAFQGVRFNNNGGTLGIVSYQNAGAGPATSFLMAEEMYDSPALSGTFWITGASGTGYKVGNILAGTGNSTGFQRQILRNIYYKNTTAVTSLSLKLSSSTFDGGTAILYGA
jgi:hypothetical protein